ncbi:hypothetical protein [Dendronalium phyllosphericum]|uniref:hypothetical protein n=1 Tax=Dendronalium phyllosphericum TaxID=2840445 RepID=UPI001BDD5E7E|nr:hypothetical protein [Dendronalium phyllosphericum]
MTKYSIRYPYPSCKLKIIQIASPYPTLRERLTANGNDFIERVRKFAPFQVRGLIEREGLVDALPLMRSLILCHKVHLVLRRDPCKNLGCSQ